MYSGPKDHTNAKGHQNKGHKAPSPVHDDMDEINSAMTGNFGMQNFMVTSFHNGPSGPVGIEVTDFNAAPNSDGMASHGTNQGLPPLSQQDDLADISLAPLSGFDSIDSTHIDTSSFETFDESKFNQPTSATSARNSAPQVQDFSQSQSAPDDFLPAINGGSSQHRNAPQGRSGNSNNLGQGNFSLNDLSPARRGQGGHAQSSARGPMQQQFSAEQAAMSAVPSRFSAPGQSSPNNFGQQQMPDLGSFSALDTDGGSFNAFGDAPAVPQGRSESGLPQSIFNDDSSMLPPSLRGNEASYTPASDGVFSESDFYESPDRVYESMQENYFKQNQPRGAFKPTEDQRFANEDSAPATWAVREQHPDFASEQGHLGDVEHSFMDERNAFAPVAGRNVPPHANTDHLQMQQLRPDGTVDTDFDPFAQPSFNDAPSASPAYFGDEHAMHGAAKAKSQAPQYLSPGVHSDDDPETRYENHQGRAINIDKEEVERRSREIWGESKEVEAAKAQEIRETHTVISGMDGAGEHVHAPMGANQAALNNPLTSDPNASLFIAPGAPLNSAMRQGVDAASSAPVVEPIPTSVKEDNPIYTAGIEGDKPREMQLLNPTAPSTLINGLAYDFNKNQNEISSGIRTIMQESPATPSPEAAFGKHSQNSLNTAITGSAAASNPYAKAFAALNRTDENRTKIFGQSSALNSRQNKDPEVSTMISHGTAAVSSGPEVNARANTNTAISGNRAAAFNQQNKFGSSSNSTTVLSMGNKIIADPYSKFNQAQSRAAELAERGTSFNFSFKGSSGRPMSPSQAASSRSASIGVGSSAGDAVAAAFASAGHTNITGNGSAALNKVVSATALGDATAASAGAASAAAAVSAATAGLTGATGAAAGEVEAGLAAVVSKLDSLFGSGSEKKSGRVDHTGAAVLSGKGSTDSKNDKTSESVKALGSATAVDMSGFVDPWLTDKTLSDTTKTKDKPKFFTDADSFKPKPKTEFMEVNPLEDIAPSQPDSESLDLVLPELSSDSPAENLTNVKKLQDIRDLDDEDEDFLGAFDHTAGNKKESKEESLKKLNFNPLAKPVSKGPEFSLRDEDILRPQSDTIAEAEAKERAARRAAHKSTGPKGDMSRSTGLWGLDGSVGAVDAFSKLTQAADKLSAASNANPASAASATAGGSAAAAVLSPAASAAAGFGVGASSDPSATFNEREFMDFASAQVDLSNAGEDNDEPLQKNPAINLNNYLMRCRSGIGQCLYLVQSGLSLDVIDGFNLGYDAYFKTKNHAYGSYNPLRPAGSRSYPALIIPLSSDSYVAYNIQSLPTKAGPGADDPVHHYIGKSQGFNLQVLDDAEANAIFICAGELDALSLLSLGQQALAIGTPLNAIHVLEHLQQLFSTGKLSSRSHTTFYICMPQQEKQWKDAAEALQAGMSAFNLNAHPLSLHSPYKSIHQALVADRNALHDRLNKLKEISEVTLQEAVHADSFPGLVLSLQSLAKLELSAMMYTLSSPAAALSRLVMASLIENKHRSILYAGSKMQWQMLCSLLSFAPNSYDQSSNHYRARFLEMPLDLNANIMDAALNHGLQAASYNGLNNPVLMVDTFAYDNDLCSKLSPRLAQLSVEFNTPIMVWCSQDQRSIFEGNSLQTLEMNQGVENEIIFTTLDSTCRTHVFSTISG